MSDDQNVKSEDQETDQKQSDEEILRVAHERFRIAEEAESELRRDMLDDLKFSAGDQWPDDVKAARELDRRPCLTINRVNPAVHQLTNDQRQNRPAIKVSPVDDGADIETAKIYQGLIRHIENASNADTAWDTGFDSTARAGLGYARIVTEFADPMSFDQELRFKRIPDRFSVYLDPSYQEPDGSDAGWGFVFEDISKDDYKAKYPKSQMASMTDWESLGRKMLNWVKENSVRVAEYFYKDYRQTTIVLLKGGAVLEKSRVPDSLKGDIVAERETLIPTVKWCKINATEILERSTWPGSGLWIPIIPILGEELVIDGKRKLSGIVRAAKDPNRMYNYWASAETETIALAPRAPFIAAEGQLEGHEQEWATANTRNHAYLQYKPTSIAGQPLPPPQRQTFEPAVQAISQARMLSSDDIKATTGIYDSALGAKSNEQSGVAIQRRNTQSQTSNFHLIDNLSKSIRHAGRILVDSIPFVYDTARAARIIGEDGTEEIVRLNQEFNRKGKAVRYDLNRGKYDVTVSTGPSYETKRQEAAATITDLVKSYPQLMQIVGDLLVKNLDLPQAQEIAERLKKMLPPPLQDDGKNGQQIPPQVQAQMQQMGALIKELTDHLNAKTQLIETKSLELESRERIEMKKIEADLQINAAKLGSQEALAMLDYQVQQIEARMQRLHENLSYQQEIESLGAQTSAAGPMNNQQPTGEEQSPGQSMGEMP